MGQIVILSAPSGSGKTTIARQLLSEGHGLEFSVSATSRSKREGEIHGKDYFFLTPDEFRMKIENNELVEWQEVYTNQYYGTLRSELNRIWAEGKVALFDVDVYGGINLKKMFGSDALSVFIRPPDLETLKTRLQNRSSDSEEQIRMRLAKAEEELSLAVHFDETVVNDELATAIKTVRELIVAFKKQAR